MGYLADAIDEARRKDDPYLDGMHVVDEAVPNGCDLTFFEFHNMEFERCSFAGATLAKASFYDCVFTGCDLSNARMDEAYVARSRLVGCKLEGVQLIKAFMRNVRLQDCVCRYGNWGESTLEATVLEDCDLREAFLNELRLRKGVRLERCDLTRADLFRTRMRGIDVSTCTIAGLGVSDTREELRGMRICAEQAADLVGLLGVRIVD